METVLQEIRKQESKSESSMTLWRCNSSTSFCMGLGVVYSWSGNSGGFWQALCKAVCMEVGTRSIAMADDWTWKINWNQEPDIAIWDGWGHPPWMWMAPIDYNYLTIGSFFHRFLDCARNEACRGNERGKWSVSERIHLSKLRCFRLKSDLCPNYTFASFGLDNY